MMWRGYIKPSLKSISAHDYFWPGVGYWDFCSGSNSKQMTNLSMRSHTETFVWRPLYRSTLQNAKACSQWSELKNWGAKSRLFSLQNNSLIGHCCTSKDRTASSMCKLAHFSLPGAVCPPNDHTGDVPRVVREETPYDTVHLQKLVDSRIGTLNDKQRTLFDQVR